MLRFVTEFDRVFDCKSVRFILPLAEEAWEYVLAMMSGWFRNKLSK